MGGYYEDYCLAKFKNQKLRKYLNACVVTETEEEEWVIMSEDETSIYLGKPDKDEDEDEDNDEDFAEFYNINKRTFKKENVKDGNIYVEVHKYTFIDLAKLYGIRNVCLGQKGDRRLTRKEVAQIVDSFNHDGSRTFMPLSKGKLTKNIERKIRLIRANFDIDEKGVTTIHFEDSFCYSEALAALMAASLKFPKARILVETHNEELDTERFYLTHTTFAVKNGKYDEVDSKYYESYYDVENEWECSKTPELKRAKRAPRLS